MQRVGADDDEDCAGHVWVLTEIGSRGLGRGLDMSSECGRCGAVRYEPAENPRSRPPL
ncbi:hypothetical protein [Microcystis phage MinS1]|nr:hypothetical protein [Microcystis phage MinS1]